MGIQVEAQRKHRLKYKQKCKELGLPWNKGDRTAQSKRYREKNRIQVRTYLRVQRAKERGDIIPPDSCSSIGCNNKPNICHHDDYDKPLEIRWLCNECHYNFHTIGGGE